MQIRRAVITLAGRTQRGLPLQNLVDRDGIEKKALQVLLEEAFFSGVEEVGLVVCPGDEAAYQDAAGQYARQISFITQVEALGYGHALLQARAFVQDQPFLHMVGDHIFLSHIASRSAQQVMDVARQEGCSVSAVQATRENLLGLYGAIAARRVPQMDRLFEVDGVREKPTPTEAEQHLLVSGLRTGTYLCFFGIHVFTSHLFALLEESARNLPAGQMLSLSPTLDRFARQERYLACEVQGRRYNMGVPYGLLNTQLALALSGKDRDQILTQLVELLALRQLSV